MKKSNDPEWTPTDIRNETNPALVFEAAEVAQALSHGPGGSGGPKV